MLKARIVDEASNIYQTRMAAHGADPNSPLASVGETAFMAGFMLGGAWVLDHLDEIGKLEI